MSKYPHPIFRHYLEGEDDKPYYTMNSLSFYYEDMERKQKLIESLAKSIAGYDIRLTENLESIEQEVDKRLADWDKQLETFPASVEDLLTKWTTDGTIDQVIQTALIDEKIAPVTAQLADIAINVKSFGAVGDGVADDIIPIQNAINFAKSKGGGTVFFPTGTYRITATMRIDSHYINLKGNGNKSKIVCAAIGLDMLNISPPGSLVIPFFSTISDLWFQGNPQNRHGIKIDYAYNVTLRDLYINGMGGDGINAIHAMNSIMDNVRSDENENGFVLDSLGVEHRCTTWSIMNSYFSNNRLKGGILSGGDSNVLMKTLFEHNYNGGLYITKGENNPNLHSCYFEYNKGNSLLIDSGETGQIFGGRFSDEGAQAHLKLGDSYGWFIYGCWFSTNAGTDEGTGINIDKTYSGGTDVIMGCHFQGATPISGNAGALKVMNNDGSMDRFKISTNDDLRINGAGNGVIVNNGQYSYKINVDANGQVVATIQ